MAGWQGGMEGGIYKGWIPPFLLPRAGLWLITLLPTAELLEDARRRSGVVAWGLRTRGLALTCIPESCGF